MDEAICDQLIDCYHSSNLCRKFLEKTGIVTLKDLRDIARAMGALDMQVKSMDKSEVNTLHREAQDRRGKG